jgi:hypothetical protein
VLFQRLSELSDDLAGLGGVLWGLSAGAQHESDIEIVVLGEAELALHTAVQVHLHTVATSVTMSVWSAAVVLNSNFLSGFKLESMLLTNKCSTQA